MTVCRRCRHWFVATALVAALLGAGRSWLWAGDNPQGKQISEIFLYGNNLHTSQQIINILHSQVGKPYDEATIQEDVRRLYNTHWFMAGAIRVSTVNEPDGRVKVFLQVQELTGTVQEVIYDGAQHLSKSDLHTITNLRKGDAMNPFANEQGRSNIQRRYQEDGRFYATVELVEGGHATDTRVVYRIVEGPMVKVADVEFVGNTHALSGRLRQQLVTRREFLGLIGGKFNPASTELDRKALTEYYHALGFLGVFITWELKRSSDMSHVTIVYHIVEGIQYHIVGKEIPGAEAFPPEKLEALTDLKAGDRYNQSVVNRDIGRIKTYIGNQGWQPNVKEEIVMDEAEPGLVRVRYNVIDPRGTPDRVGRIIIEGNTVTQDRVILNQLDLRPGQILQYPKLEDARMRLNRLGIFDPEDPPTVEVVPNDLDETFKDIRVRVHETRTGQFMIGGSVNSDAGLTGNIAINERNFDILRFPTSLDDFRYGTAWRGAGQELRIEAAPGTNLSRYSVTWREPYLFDTPFGLTTSFYFYNRSYTEYTEDRVGARITLDRRLDPIWKASVSTRVEGVNINSIPLGAPPTIANAEGEHLLVGVRAGLNRDTRDSYVYPTKGNVFDVGVEQVFGTYSFPVVTAEFSQFFSSQYLAREDGSGRHVLGLRTQVGYAGNDTPVFERFYAGGIRSFRGFQFRGVGPFEDGFAVGGKFSFLNTIEYQVPVIPSDKLFVVAFVDHGTVEETAFTIKNYRVAVGTGLRIAIPALGPLPLALDFGVPVVQAPGDKRQLFSFSVGLFGGR
jgi:outer membrane protein assembly complex protein YaeT